MLTPIGELHYNKELGPQKKKYVKIMTFLFCFVLFCLSFLVLSLRIMDTEINEMIRKTVACNLQGKKNVDFTW